MMACLLAISHAELRMQFRCPSTPSTGFESSEKGAVRSSLTRLVRGEKGEKQTHVCHTGSTGLTTVSASLEKEGWVYGWAKKGGD